MTKNTGELLDQLCEILNKFGAEKKEAKVMFEALWKQHRTLQQNFWRTIQLLAEQYAHMPLHMVDKRNEKAHQLCKAITCLDISLPII